MEISVVLLLLFVLTGAEGSHIVGGRDSAPHSRPYMAALQVRGRLLCGGVLLKRDFVLTAAHCRVTIPMEVVLGVDSLRPGNDTTKQTFMTVRAIPHPNYNGVENDIMLLKLNGNAQLSDSVQLIARKRGWIRASRKCLTAGWGDVGDNQTLAATLQEVNVTTLPLSTCRRRWQTVSIARTMVCGVGDRSFQGFCSGDSGGPLVCDGQVAGVVSFSGRRCGDSRTPDVYTRVSTFRDWIESVISNN